MKTKQIAVPLQIIHETANDGRHRLLLIHNGIPQTSDWIEPRQFSFFKGYVFHQGALGALPTIFRSPTEVSHEVLV